MDNLFLGIVTCQNCRKEYKNDNPLSVRHSCYCSKECEEEAMRKQPKKRGGATTDVLANIDICGNSKRKKNDVDGTMTRVTPDE
jgi:hypothetical protein